ncbi:MAG: O-antigen ligase family protein [Planctomycetota bacterium]
MDPGRLKTLCRLLAFVFATACLVARPLVPGPNVHGGVDFFLGLWVLFAYFFLLLGMLLDGEVRIPIPGVGGMLALLAAFAFLSVTWSARKISALEHASELLALAALYGTVMAFEAKERAILARCFLAVATAVAVCAIYQYFIGLPELRRVLELHPERIPVEKALLGDYLSRLNTDRAFATLLYPNALAGYLLIAIPVGLGILAQRISGLKMRGWVAVVEVGAVALVGYGLILTFSKGGWVAATAGLLVFGILAAKFAGRLDGRRLAWLGAAAAFLAVVVYTGGRAGVLPRPGEYIASSRVRAEYAGVAVAMIRDNSWIGVGAGGFGDHYARYKTPEAEETQKAHNNFLQVAAELGVGGLLVFAGMWVVFLSGVVRSFRAGSKNPISDETDSPSAGSLRGAACIAGLMAFLIGAMWGMDEPLVRMWSLMTFAAVAAAGVFGNGVTDGPYVRAGAAAGAVGFFVHNFADFDWYVPAVAQAGLVVMALSRPSPRRFVRVRIGRAVAAAAVMGGAVVLGFLCCVVYPRLLTARFAQEEAEAHMREGKVAEAVACLERAAAANPLDDEIAFERAGACATLGRRTGDRARALSGFERAIALDPVKSVYHFTLAEFVGEDDPVTALSEYRAAARLYPAKPIYHLELAKALERAGNAAEAIAEYRETLRLHGAVTVKRLRLEAADARFVRERIAALEGKRSPP